MNHNLTKIITILNCRVIMTNKSSKKIFTGEGDLTEDSTCINDFWMAFTAIFSFIELNWIELNEFWLALFCPTVLAMFAVSNTLNNNAELSVILIKIIAFQCDLTFKTVLLKPFYLKWHSLYPWLLPKVLTTLDPN